MNTNSPCKYILLDYTNWEVSVVSKLPEQRKGYVIEGKYIDGTDKDLQVCDNNLSDYINVAQMIHRKKLTILKG